MPDISMRTARSICIIIIIIIITGYMYKIESSGRKASLLSSGYLRFIRRRKVGWTSKINGVWRASGW